MDRELVILGAGASGLMAAYTAASLFQEKAQSPCLLDGNAKAGRKLLTTGNGRCNLTNLHISPDRYHGDKLAEEVLKRFPAQRVLNLFGGMGLLTRADGEGRVYPRGNQAAAVLDALRRPRGPVDELCGFQAVSAERTGRGFRLESADGRAIRARRLILACGGSASPGHSTGSGYGLARALGHTVTSLSPSLAPLKTSSKACKSLKGMRVRAKVTLYKRGRPVYAESGEVIFGNDQLSGICVFDLSARLRETGLKDIEVGLDLLEEMTEKEALSYVQTVKKRSPDLPAADLFAGALNLRVGQELTKGLKLTKDRPLSTLTDRELGEAAGRAKDWRFPITGTGSWEDAQVTAGGVPLSEIDLDTMESKICPGLYLCGELLDADGDCGGYNLHWAWSTGFLAGSAAAKGLLTEGGRRPC